MLLIVRYNVGNAFFELFNLRQGGSHVRDVFRKTNERALNVTIVSPVPFTPYCAFVHSKKKEKTTHTFN